MHELLHRKKKAGSMASVMSISASSEYCYLILRKFTCYLMDFIEQVVSADSPYHKIVVCLPGLAFSKLPLSFQTTLSF